MLAVLGGGFDYSIHTTIIYGIGLVLAIRSDRLSPR